MDSEFFPLPTSRRISRIIFYTGVFVFVGGMLVTGWKFNWDSKLFPLVVGVPTLAVTTVHLLFLAFPSVEERVLPEMSDSEGLEELDEMIEGTEEVGRSKGAQQKYELIMVGWLLALGLLIIVFGYAILPLFLIVFWHFLIDDLRKSIMLSVGYTVLAYFVFIWFLGMRPWRGLIYIPIPGIT